MSPLDLLSSAAPSPTLKRSMCGNCEACLRENCGECVPCRDKPKFGGPNRMRKKCIKRRCPNMAPHSFMGPSSKSCVAVAKLPKVLVGKLEKSPTAERKAVAPRVAPNMATLAAEKRWAENLQALRPCLAPGGGAINYAAIEDEDVRNRVKNFVKEQRKSYRRREGGESTSMTDERLRLLEEAGFPFVARHQAKVCKPAAASSTTYGSEKRPTSSLELLISATSQSIGPDVSAAEVLPEKPTSSLDLLCSITAKSFDESGSFREDAVVDDEEEQERRASPAPPAPIPPPSPPATETSAVSGSEPAKLKAQRTKGPNCGRCAACTRDDCGECRACLDKPKFGGPNTMKRRCFKRYCVSRKPDERPPQERRGRGGHRTCSDAVMKAELAKIKAELEAKAQGMEFGFRGRMVENLPKEAEQSEDQDTVTESCAEKFTESCAQNAKVKDAKKGPRRKVASRDEPDNAVYKVGVLDLPRGITMRPSGKWQVQLYYDGHSRYIGLFNTKQEAAMAYEMARDCRGSFREENPTPQQVKRNLDLMRKAAFSGGRYYEETSSRVDQPRQQKSPEFAAPPKWANADDATTAKSKSAKTKSQPDLRARAREPTRGSGEAIEKKPSSKPQSGRANEKPQKAKLKAEDETKIEVIDDAESRKQKFNSDIYRKAKALADALPRGITIRPSGKWQVQLYYAGKSRYIGVFESKLDAALAYEIARYHFSSFKNGDPSPEQAKKNVELMRNAAFSYIRDDSNKRKPNMASDSPAASRGDKSKKRSKPSANKQQAEQPAPLLPMLHDKSPDSKKILNDVKVPENKRARRTLAVEQVPTQTSDCREPAIKEFPEIGPGWKVNIVPRRSGQRSDCWYISPNGEHFRSFKEAKASAGRVIQDDHDVTSSSGQFLAIPDQEVSSADGLASLCDGTVIGAVGYKFRKLFTDEKGEDARWYEGEVVGILSGSEKDRKCLYPADGYTENLSVTELKELAQLEMKTHTRIGSIGWRFKKQLPGGKWCNGEVVKILKDARNGKDRRCHYPANDDFDDFSLVDLKELAKLEKIKEKVDDEPEHEPEQVQHNDLCETCGEAGELLCCSTCNLVFHLGCTRPKLTELPADDWSCAFCVASGDVVKNMGKEEQQKALLAVEEIETLKEEARKKKSRRTSPRKRKNPSD